MKSITFLVFFVFFQHVVFATEIFYPNETLRNDPVENALSLYPTTPSNNRVSVDYAPGGDVVDPDSVYAGWTKNGMSENNHLTFKNGHAVRFVFGGFSLKGNVKNNSVVFSDGVAADAAIGKLCGGQTKDGDVIENSVTISGGRIVGDVYGGDADADGNAVGNRVEITGGKLSGFVNGGGVSGVGIAEKNRITISGGSVGMGVSAGFAHFVHRESDEKVTNSVLGNIITISGNTEITGNVSGGFVLDSNGSVDANTVEISGGTIRGDVFGGRAFNGGTNGNTVRISGGTIRSRNDGPAFVYGGYVHKPNDKKIFEESSGDCVGVSTPSPALCESTATKNSVVLSGSPNLEMTTLYGNNLSTWKTDENTLSFEGFQGTVQGFSRFQRIDIDENSRVTVRGNPMNSYEISEFNNKGVLIFKNGKFTFR